MNAKWSFRAEPTAWVEVVRQGLYFASLMNWLALDDAQTGALMMFVSMLLAAINRSFVQPVDR